MLVAGTPIGKYVVRRKIAEGGMAEIYLCSSRGPEGFEKDVVIKRIRSFLAGDQTFVQMFIGEARVASRLNHANLVQIFDFDKHEDTYYLAMEYVRGHSLWDARKRAKEVMLPMAPTLVAKVAAEVARGLGYAHKLQDKGKPLNLVHRDVTPHNVLLSYDGAVKLTDFGVAKHSASSTSAGVLKGKFAYMSPEQARGEPVDARTDLFALGITLWEMLTGARLFHGDSDVAVLRAVQSSAIAPPSRLNPDVPEALSALVMKALERDPAQRFQSAQEMERALAEFVLSHARSLNDTDLAGYLHTLYADELAQEAAREGTRSGPAPSAGAPPPREPTALLKKGGSGEVPRPASPDEDMHASTHVVDPVLSKTEVRSAPAAPELEPPPEQPGPPSVIADLSVAPLPVAPPRRSGPRQAPLPPPTLALPAMRRPPRPTVGMRRALMAGGLLSMAIAAAGVTIAVSRRTEPPAPVPAPAPAPVASAPDQVPTPAPARESPPPAASPAPAAAPSTPAAAPEPAVAAGEGNLVVRVRPYADVFIDEKRRREVQGAASFRLPAGPHKVRLQHPRGSYQTTVIVHAGKDAVVEKSFLGR